VGPLTGDMVTKDGSVYSVEIVTVINDFQEGVKSETSLTLDIEFQNPYDTCKLCSISGDVPIYLPTLGTTADWDYILDR
jgi:hypothetical protein